MGIALPCQAFSPYPMGPNICHIPYPNYVFFPIPKNIPNLEVGNLKKKRCIFNFGVAK
jgi:hypothetical protein